jgi:hypothetical protein
MPPLRPESAAALVVHKHGTNPIAVDVRKSGDEVVCLAKMSLPKIEGAIPDEWICC